MTINLVDIKTASEEYLKTSVICTVGEVKPDVLKALSPNEGFTVDLRLKNTGGLRVINVIYYVKVSDAKLAKLVAPGISTWWAPARDAAVGGKPIPGGQEVAEMYLVNVDAARKSLEPGEEVSWTLRGKALKLGTFEIYFKVLGEVDVNYLFTENAPSKRATGGPVPIV